jgi:hypothetical protein
MASFVHAASYIDRRTKEQVYIYEDHPSLFDCQIVRRIYKRRKIKVKVEGYWKD